MKKPSKLFKFYANLVAGFIPFHDKRSAVRRNIIYKKPYKLIKEQWCQTSESRDGGGTKKSPIPARFREYDYVFTIGANCDVTTCLRTMGLSIHTTPIDWTSGDVPADWLTGRNSYRDSMFTEKINAIVNDFEHFFDFQDFVIRTSQTIAQPHQDLINTNSGIRFAHVFPTNQSWELYFPTAQKIIQRRATRMLEYMNNAKKILVVWASRISGSRNMFFTPITDQEIKDAVKKMSKKFPNADIDFVFFEHDGTKKQFEYDKREICTGAYRIFSNHFILTDDYVYAHPSSKNCIPFVMCEMLDNISTKETA